MVAFVVLGGVSWALEYNVCILYFSHAPDRQAHEIPMLIKYFSYGFSEGATFALTSCKECLQSSWSPYACVSSMQHCNLKTDIPLRER